MVSSLDSFETGFRPYEQPLPRYGSGHIVRDEIPAIDPEISSFAEKQKAAERALKKMLAEERAGQIAVAAAVSIEDTGLYL